MISHFIILLFNIILLFFSRKDRRFQVVTTIMSAIDDALDKCTSASTAVSICDVHA